MIHFKIQNCNRIRVALGAWNVVFEVEQEQRNLFLGWH